MLGKLKKTAVVLVMGASSLAAVSAVGVQAASATPACQNLDTPGYLCFQNFPSAKGGVAGWNAWWGNFGWNDCADYFVNRGTHNAKIWADINYAGEAHTLSPGGYFTWYDQTSSNGWY